MLICCPVCGPRETTEFVYAGDASVVRPPLEADEAAWAGAVYERANPRGAHREWWQQVGGCRAVVCVQRDTETHAIAGVELVGPDRAWLP